MKRIYANLSEPVDLIVIKNGTDPHIDLSFFYVTDLTSGLFEGAVAFLYPDSSLEVLTTQLEEESAKKGNFPVTAVKTRADAEKIMARKLKKARKIGINSNELTYSNFLSMKKANPNAKFIDVSSAIVAARAVKDSGELERIRTACKITSQVGNMIPDMFQDKVREYEFSAEIVYTMQKLGASGPSFTTITAFGPNSAEPHHSSSNRKIGRGDFALFDFGARYIMYCSDVSRTFFYGKVAERQEEMYDIVSRAQAIALKSMRAGVNGRTVHNKVEEFINGTKYKGRFIHGLGHGLGLTTHDPGGLSGALDFKLKENMVLTVEPGVYIPKYGGVRIEDDVIVKKNGVEVITNTRKDLLVI